MKIAIVGEPQSGKTSLLELLRAGGGARRGKQDYEAVIEVPDERIDWLTRLYQPKKSTLATLEFTDPGGDLRHGGLGLEELLALPDVQQSDALVLVLGVFAGGNPIASVESFELATALADLAVVERRIERLQADRKRGLKDAETELPLLSRLHDHLLSERPLRAMGLSEDEGARLRGYQFLSLKPVLVVANVAEDRLAGHDAELVAACAKAHHELCVLSAAIEAELAEMSAEDRAVFMAELGIQTVARDRFLRAAYASLGLASFLTVGPDECRAWTIRVGATAPEAAGCIHSDLQRGFIRAEVVAYEDLESHGDMKSAKAAGVVRLEGKDYVVQDGDVMEIRFSV